MPAFSLTRRTLVLLVALLTLATVTTLATVHPQTAQAVQADGCPPGKLCNDEGTDVDQDADTDTDSAADTDTKTETTTTTEAPKENSITRYGTYLIAALGTGMVLVAGWN